MLTMIHSIRTLATIALFAGTILSPFSAPAAQHKDANLYAYWDFSGHSGFWNVD